MIDDVNTENDDPRLNRALSYPYAIPSMDFVLSAGRAHMIDKRKIDLEELLYGRKPILAVGSNRAPAQLLRKFGERETIPVLSGNLYDHDVVYAGLISDYGAIPATLIYSRDSVCNVGITWLTDNQFSIMDKTEGLGTAYNRRELEGLGFVIRGMGNLDRAYTYLACNGALQHNNTPISVAEIRGKKRGFQTKTQREVQEIAQNALSPETSTSLEQFVLDNVRDPVLRHKRSEALKEISCDLGFPKIETNTQTLIF